MLTMANNGLVHDIFKDLAQAESYVHYTGLDNMICHEGLNCCQKIAEAGEDGYFVDYKNFILGPFSQINYIQVIVVIF